MKKLFLTLDVLDKLIYDTGEGDSKCLSMCCVNVKSLKTRPIARVPVKGITFVIEAVSSVFLNGHEIEEDATFYVEENGKSIKVRPTEKITDLLCRGYGTVGNPLALHFPSMCHHYNSILLV